MQQSPIPRHRLLKITGLLMIPGVLSPAVAGDGASTNGLDPEIADAFGIESGSVISIEIDHTPGVPVSVVVPIDGSDYTLDLVPYSVRADDFVVYLQLPDGTYEQRQSVPPRTVQGDIRELEGGIVTGSVLGDGLTARIEMPDGEVFWIAPVASKVSGREPDLHVVYQADCAGVDGGACGVSDDSLAAVSDAGSDSADFSPSGVTHFAELALDADFEYFTRWGPDPDDVVARMELVIAIVNVQYERDVDIVHIITAAFVRTSEPDPYSSTNPATLLMQFTNHWRNSEPERSVPRDLAHLFTGKDLVGAIGIAWANSVCGSFGFSLAQSDYIDELDCVTDLTARQLGYMWGAGPHGIPGWTMGPSADCSNRFHPDLTIPDIVEFRDSLLCLDEVSEICIVHGNPDWDRDDPETWVSFNEWAFGSYIYPKVESTDGVNLDLGLDTFNVVFTLEPFGDPEGGPVTPDNVIVEETGGGDPPNIVNVTKDGFNLTVELDRIITLREWTTLIFMVYSGDGVQIADDGNEGEGVQECARLDVGFLPADVNNDGAAQPLDLSRWISSWNGGNPIFPSDVEPGDPPDYLDIDGNGLIQPRDLNFLIRALKGDPPFTRNWRNVRMKNRQP